mgnify:CR=1 FL=1
MKLLGMNSAMRYALFADTRRCRSGGLLAKVLYSLSLQSTRYPGLWQPAAPSSSEAHEKIERLLFYPAAELTKTIVAELLP